MNGGDGGAGRVAAVGRLHAHSPFSYLPMTHPTDMGGVVYALTQRLCALPKTTSTARYLTYMLGLNCGSRPALFASTPNT